MKEILFLTVLTGLLLIGSVLIFIVGLIKRQKRLLLISMVTFLLTIGIGSLTAYHVATKSYDRVAAIFRPRTGEEIYVALLGKPHSDCVKVKEYQDQIIPRIDFGIFLHFDACPEELSRILSSKEYTSKRVSTKDWSTDGPLANQNWFKPELLGDTILVFEYSDQSGNGQEIYSNLEKTEIYLLDIAD